MNRPTIDEYFLKIALVVAERSTCKRHHIGAVASRDRHILATGYNGAPSGLKDCSELGCAREGIPSGVKTELCRAVHSEMNLIVQAGMHGTSLIGATVYCTHNVCTPCAKALINSKIARFVYCIGYKDVGADVYSHVILKQAGIEIVELPIPKVGDWSHITELEDRKNK